MAVLSFKVQADYEKVVKLREEISKLETQLRSFGKNTPLNEIKAVETKLSEARKEFTALATEAAESGAVVNSTTKTMAKNIAALFTVQKATEFAAQVATVRGEFQKLEIAFETMLQSKERADALMAQIVETAAKTPFDLHGVASGAKQLLAYGVASDQVNDTLIRLGDIASGLSIPLGDLVYLYGTTMAQGRMFTMDLRQFQGRGIPMAEELAKVMGVTKREVSELVTAGKVGFPEMEQAIKNMTTEGGKFAGLMEKQSKTITGQLSNLEDSIAQMFNEIGQSTEGVISGAIGVVSDLVENYKEVGEVIAQIALVYGTYKAAVVAYSAVNAAAIKAEKDMLLQLLAVKAQETAVDNANVATSGRVVAANNAEIVSLRAELEAKRQSLVQTMLSAKAEEAAALTKVERTAVQLSLSKLQVTQAKKELAMAIATGDAEAIAAAKSNLAAAAKQRNILSTEASAAAKALEVAATNAETATSAVNTLQTQMETAAIDNQTRATLLLTAAKKGLISVGKGIGVILTNPFVLATAAVAGLAYGIYKVIDVINVEDEAHENVTKSIEKHKNALDGMKTKGEELINTIKDENSTQMEKVKAMEELRALYPNLFKDMSDDELLTMKQTEATRQLTEETERLTEAELRNQIALKQKALAEKENAKPVTGSTEAQVTMAAMNSIQAERLRKEIEELEKELANFEELKKKAEFSALPKEAKIISLKEQIETLKNENLELDKQISDAEAKQDELGNLSGLSFKVNLDPDIEAKFAKIRENRKKYEELQRDLDKLEQDSDKGGLSAKQKQANYNRKKAKEKSELEMARMEVDLRHKVTQSSINAMDEGFAKENAQIKLNFEKQQETYKRELEDYLKKLQEDEKQRWLAVDPEGRKEYDFVPTITEDSEEYKKVEAQYAQLGKDAAAAFDKAVLDAETEWVFSKRQIEVDSMSEGTAKDIAQRALDNEKEIYELEQQREAYIASAKAIHDYNQEREKAKNPEHEVVAWSEEDRVNANAEYDAIVEGKKKQHRERLLQDYMSYMDKEKELTAQYNADIAELEAAFLATGDERFKRSIDERTKAYAKSMNSLEQEYGTADYRLIFGDPSKMTSATIEKALGVARQKLSQVDFNADPETFIALSEAIERLETARDSNPFEGWDTSLMGVAQRFYQIANIKKDIEKYEEEGNTEALEASEAELEKSKKNLKKALAGTGISMFGQALSKAAASMREVAEASGDIDLMEQAEALEKAGSFISSVASGAASGSWIGAIVGGATSLMDMLISSITESEVVAAEAKKAYEDYLDEIARSKRQINEEDYETIFGVRALEKVVDASRLAAEAWEDYQKAMNATYGDPSKKSYIAGLEDLFKRTGDLVPKMREVFKNIFTYETDDSGRTFASGINLEEAKILLDTYRDDPSQNQSLWYKGLEDAVNALEDYENNVKVVDDYLASLFSNVGSDIADAIMQGNDALEVLRDNAGDIFASIAKDMIMSTLMSTEFIEDYKKRLRDAMATEGAADDADVLASFVDELGQRIGSAQEKWAELQKIAEEKGIDLTGLKEDTTQQSASRGYQNLSEDTGGELVGRAIAQYESNLRIEASVREAKEIAEIMAAGQVQIKDIAAESRALIADSYLELQQIRENTGAIIKPIKNLSDKIDNWDSKIMSL